MTKTKRIWELDFLRGFSIIMMVWDHLMYDLKSLPYWFSNYHQVNNPIIENWVEFAQSYWSSTLREYGHWVFVAIFLLVSGISFTFSRSNLSRGLKLLLVAVIISVITMTLESVTGLAIGIFFGIIHMFAVGTLFIYYLRKLWDNNIFILLIGLIIVGLGVVIQWDRVSYYNTVTLSNFWEIIIGLKGYGADFFGVIPYVGVIMIGTVMGKVFYTNRVSLLPAWDKKWNRPFTFAGQKSLIIFVTHQVILAGIIFIVGYFLGYSF
ncbi:MAG: hypothetical protein CVV56_04675 [Tenericutes bacterium HGW-Tenericutes-1]|jgi:uncharacterized membrane protein|nr:MAG: hypothetical protein CVV56_04675 [Tenericutes bacterium HGW-Tenericutes-1]